MAKLFLVEGASILFALALITQVLIPAFVPSLPLFWLFKRKNNENNKQENEKK